MYISHYKSRNSTKYYIKKHVLLTMQQYKAYDDVKKCRKM